MGTAAYIQSVSTEKPEIVMVVQPNRDPFAPEHLSGVGLKLAESGLHWVNKVTIPTPVILLR